MEYCIAKHWHSKLWKTDWKIKKDLAIQSLGKALFYDNICRDRREYCWLATRERCMRNGLWCWEWRGSCHSGPGGDIHIWRSFLIQPQAHSWTDEWMHRMNFQAATSKSWQDLLVASPHNSDLWESDVAHLGKCWSILGIAPSSDQTNSVSVCFPISMSSMKRVNSVRNLLNLTKGSQPSL